MGILSMQEHQAGASESVQKPSVDKYEEDSGLGSTQMSRE
jgi:hypothetical protein